MSQSGRYAPVPGPENREDFFAAQARNRRAGRWFTGWSALAVLLTGIPLSAVVTPLLAALAVVALDLVNFVVPTPDLLRPVAEADSATGPVSPEVAVAAAAALVVPGALVLMLTWVTVRRMFRRAGSGATVLALGARPPRAGDLEETQLANVVGEMAAAAGVPAPAVMLLDSPVPNAAVVGSRLDDCTVVVTTGLLAELDREETQGVVGHVVASAGNGDLRIGGTIASVFQTLGLVGSVLRAPTERRPRATLRRFLRYVLRRRSADDAATLAEALARAGTDSDPDYDAKDPGAFRSIVTLPFLVAGGAFSLTSMIFGFLVVNPFLRRAWRARRHLADAAAVQLTRNPDGLARALAKLHERGGVVPGTEWTAHLFVVGDATPRAGDEAPMRTFHPNVVDRVDRLRAMGSSVDALPRQTYSARQRALLWLVAVVTAPCWLPIVVLPIGAALVLTAVSLAIDSLFLAPMVALVHALLRNLAG